MNSLEYMDYPRVLQSVMHVLSMASAVASLALMTSHSTFHRPSAPVPTHLRRYLTLAWKLSY